MTEQLSGNRTALDAVEVGCFGDGDWYVVHTSKAADAVCVLAWKWESLLLPADEAQAIVDDLRLEDSERTLVRHATWPQEDGTFGEEWAPRDSDFGPTEDEKPGVIFDEDNSSEIMHAFNVLERDHPELCVRRAASIEATPL